MVVWNILWQDKKNLNIKNLFLSFGFLSPFYCALCICIRHRPNLRCWQKYQLSPKEKHSPSIKKTTLLDGKVTFLLDLVRGSHHHLVLAYLDCVNVSDSSSNVQSSVSKNLCNCVLTSNGRTALRAFWDAVPVFVWDWNNTSFIQWPKNGEGETKFTD